MKQLLTDLEAAIQKDQNPEIAILLNKSASYIEALSLECRKIYDENGFFTVMGSPAAAIGKKIQIAQVVKQVAAFQARADGLGVENVKLLKETAGLKDLLEIQTADCLDARNQLQQVANMLGLESFDMEKVTDKLRVEAYDATVEGLVAHEPLADHIQPYEEKKPVRGADEEMG